MHDTHHLPAYLAPVRAAVVAIGKELDSEARPYFLAYMRPLEALHPMLMPQCGEALGVSSMPDLAYLFDQWGDASVRDDAQACSAIDAQFDAAGVSALVRQALQAAGRLSAMLPALLPNRQSTLH
jgi:hypothetical protein